MNEPYSEWQSYPGEVKGQKHSCLCLKQNNESLGNTRFAATVIVSFVNEFLREPLSFFTEFQDSDSFFFVMYNKSIRNRQRNCLEEQFQ